MSVVENLMPRRSLARARAETGARTPVEFALATPLPSGIEDAVAKVKAALEGFNLANDGYNSARSVDTTIGLDHAAKAAESAFHDAVVRREVADQLGDDGPSTEEIQALEAAFNRAKSALEGIEMRKEAYGAAVETRREKLSEAKSELWEIVRGWADNAYEAADSQLADGVKLIGEALHLANALATWQPQNTNAGVSQRSIAPGSDQTHRGPESVELPKDIGRAISAWRSADRAVNRR